MFAWTFRVSFSLLETAAPALASFFRITLKSHPLNCLAVVDLSLPTRDQRSVSGFQTGRIGNFAFVDGKGIFRGKMLDCVDPILPFFDVPKVRFSPNAVTGLTVLSYYSTAPLPLANRRTPLAFVCRPVSAPCTDAPRLLDRHDNAYENPRSLDRPAIHNAHTGRRAQSGTKSQTPSLIFFEAR